MKNKQTISSLKGGGKTTKYYQKTNHGIIWWNFCKWYYLKNGKNIHKKYFWKWMNKMANNDKTTSSCLRVKPPYEKRGFRHMMKFWKTGILMGGLTLMPRYKKQG